VGNADILLKVEGESRFGNWSYEVQDTKLSQNTRAATVLQLCVYTELLAEIQGAVPRLMHVVMPGEDFPMETFLFADFRAYYRLIKSNFEQAIANARQTFTLTRSCNVLSADGGNNVTTYGMRMITYR
jgi:uncharacterized protein